MSDPNSQSDQRPVVINGDATLVQKAREEGEIYACWNEIGVHGDGSCPELKKYIRCRNCPVYSGAGIKLLDRALPAEYRREWTEHFAKEKKLPPPIREKAVLFRIGAEWLALPARAFHEIADHRPIHSLPHRRQGIMLGLANIRGELLICFSLGHLLGLDGLPQPMELRQTYERLLVADWMGRRIAFPVDEVRGIHPYDQQELRDPPATLSKSSLSYTKSVLNWERRSVGLLDPDILFTSLNRSLS